MVFADNDRPGIMLASAARTYLNHYGVAVGKNVGVYTANDSAYAAALDLKKAGVGIAAIVDLRDNPTGPAVDEARALGIEIHHGRAVVRAGGRLRVSSMTVQAKNGGPERTIPVDAILMSAGWTPSVHLFSQSRGKVAFDDATQALPARPVCAGLRLGRRLQRHRRPCRDRSPRRSPPARRRRRKPAASRARAPGIKAADVSEGWAGGMLGAAPGAGADTTVKAFVDFQNDVTAKDIRLAVREGMRSIEHVKRFTTNGMATDQGKTSNMHGLAIAAETLGKAIPEVGLTTFRAPYTPVTFGAIVNHARGPLFDPTRRTPIHPWAEAQRRGVRGCRPVEARLVFSARRRGHACRGQPRMRDRAQGGRPVRRLDARQDRGGRPGRGEVHGAALHQPVGEARARPLPLWHHAARGRLHLRRRRGRPAGARPLPRDDDDRRRAARHEPHGGLSPDRVPASQRLADLDHRAMGGDRRAGAEVARDHRAAGRRHRPVGRGDAAYVGARGQDLRRADAAVPHVVHRRARLRGQRAGRLRPGGLGGAVGGGREARRLRLRHRGDARAARREGLHHRRPGHRRHGDAERCRARLGGRQEEDRLRRHPRHDAAGPRRARAASSWSA